MPHLYPEGSTYLFVCQGLRILFEDPEIPGHLCVCWIWCLELLGRGDHRAGGFNPALRLDYRSPHHSDYLCTVAASCKIPAISCGYLFVFVFIFVCSQQGILVCLAGSQVQYST